MAQFEREQATLEVSREILVLEKIERAKARPRVIALEATLEIAHRARADTQLL